MKSLTSPKRQEKFRKVLENSKKSFKNPKVLKSGTFQVKHVETYLASNNFVQINYYTFTVVTKKLSQPFNRCRANEHYKLLVT